MSVHGGYCQGTHGIVLFSSLWDVRCVHAGVHVRDEGIELRPAQYYTQHGAGIYQGAKPGKLKGLAHANQSVHRVSASLHAQYRCISGGISYD